MSDQSKPQQGHRIPTLYGFLIVERPEPPPAMIFATVKKDWTETEGKVDGDMDVAIYVHMEALSPKLMEEVKEYLRHVAPPNPAELHADTRAEICPGWKVSDDESE